MTTAEQQQYLHHDDNSGSRLTPLTPMMPNGNPRSMKIVEGGYCADTEYEEKLQEKGAQHEALEEALKDYGHNVTLCSSKDWYRAWTCKQSYVQIALTFCFDNFYKILTSRRVLKRERQSNADRTGQIHLRFRVFPSLLGYGLWT
ncbi:TPA: hypothetical protein ACH3X1_000958 [Trebouxia sp. C0004]